jgi:transcriptional regulator with XRE-family HTH domain
MSTDQSLIVLIAKAGTIAGSEYKLAKAMGIPQQTLSNWKAGTRTRSPEDRARLAGFFYG